MHCVCFFVSDKTLACDFEDKFLCGYEFSGWLLGQFNTLSTRDHIEGQFYTKSNAPQYDNTIGKYPGIFMGIFKTSTK